MCLDILRIKFEEVPPMSERPLYFTIKPLTNTSYIFTDIVYLDETFIKFIWRMDLVIFYSSHIVLMLKNCVSNFLRNNLINIMSLKDLKYSVQLQNLLTYVIQSYGKITELSIKECSKDISEKTFTHLLECATDIQQIREFPSELKPLFTIFTVILREISNLYLFELEKFNNLRDAMITRLNYIASKYEECRFSQLILEFKILLINIDPFLANFDTMMNCFDKLKLQFATIKFVTRNDTFPDVDDDLRGALLS